MTQASPITIPPTQPSRTLAAVIFLHGFGDDAEGWTGLVQQFQSAGKLPHVKWILPNAPHNHDAMAQAWFEPKGFSPIPMPRRSGEDDMEDVEDDEENMRKSMEYVCGLIEGEIKEGVPLERIVLGGFSQGCAISLLVGLMSRYQGKLGGIAGLSGYLPLSGKVKRAVEAEGGVNTADGERKMKWFLAHGTRDQLVPMRMFRQYRDELIDWEGDTNVECHVYEGMQHSTAGAEIRDLCMWLEGRLPVDKAEAQFGEL